VPHAWALPRSLDVARSLRPFKRPWRAGRARRVDLDATVRGYARSRELIPFFRPAPERWFDLIIVIDRAASMAVWRETMADLQQVMLRTGAFRRLQTWGLDTSEGRFGLRDSLGRAVSRERANSTGGRRLVLVASDCTASAWRDGRAWNLLQGWATTVPTVLVNPLPPRLWRYKGLPAARANSPWVAGQPNTALQYQAPLIELNGDTGDRRNWTALPVLTLTPHSVSRWARTLMRVDDSGCDALLIPTPTLLRKLDQARNLQRADTQLRGRSAATGSPSSKPSMQRLVDGFVYSAAPNAVRLAALCTADDSNSVDLGLLHLIRDQAVRDATISDLAEVIISGLFTISTDQQGDPVLRFREGVRDHLKGLLGAHEYWLLRVTLSRYLQVHPSGSTGISVIASDVDGDRSAGQAKPFADAPSDTFKQEDDAVAGLADTVALPQGHPVTRVSNNGLQSLAVTGSHHGSHRDLLLKPGLETQRRVKLDAIIVPTIRHPASLLESAELAIALNAPLITLHSGKWTSAAVAASRLPAKTDLIAIDIPDRTRLRLPKFATSSLLVGTRFDRLSDTSSKRNIGLMLCHMLGWKHVAFLDDDIEIPDPTDLELAAGLLDTHNIVGPSDQGFPGDSVVCHAYRRVGGSQESFIGSGAIVVEAERTPSFFPNIYHDVWFYMLDDVVGALQPVATIGRVIQRYYEPFRNPDRARAEEFGDVLAEGVFWLFDQGRSLLDADVRHWKDFLAKRATFINHLLGLVDASAIASAEKRRMVEALKAARGRLTFITPDLCRDYLQALATDRRVWQSHMESLEVGSSRRAAIRQLSPPDQPLLTCYLGAVKPW
jgi:hypothetical protein